MVGATGIEPAASRSRTERTTAVLRPDCVTSLHILQTSQHPFRQQNVKQFTFCFASTPSPCAMLLRYSPKSVGIIFQPNIAISVSATRSKAVCFSLRLNSLTVRDTAVLHPDHTANTQTIRQTSFHPSRRQNVKQFTFCFTSTPSPYAMLLRYNPKYMTRTKNKNVGL